MDIIHISAECYPAAKAGGLGDVVGALPKYLNQKEVSTAVIMPKYYTPWLLHQRYALVYTHVVQLGQHRIPFAIEKVVDDPLGFPLYVANIPGKFDRPGIYSDPGGWYYQDELERFLCFQQAALHWLCTLRPRPKLIHCHDHHTGLVPFLMQHSEDFKKLKKVPSVFTIHNAEYHGAFSWEKANLLPPYEEDAKGLLDWNHSINPLTTGIKAAWRVTTVSPNYMRELSRMGNDLGWLLQHESEKTLGILNGIDAQHWDPEADPMLFSKLDDQMTAFKAANKMPLVQRFTLRPDLPLITFIGRLVREKGADLIPDLLNKALHSGLEFSFIVLGTGEPRLHEVLGELQYHHPGHVGVALEYNEGLAHQLYAGSDFLFMPSRVEPCGLNQMYAMRYGTVPIVRTVGGLKDTVVDVAEDPDNGRGIRFDEFNLEASHHALLRAVELYWDTGAFHTLRERIAALDFSWERSAGEYLDLYQTLNKKLKRTKAD